jgi:hypothetical protein
MQSDSYQAFVTAAQQAEGWGMSLSSRAVQCKCSLRSDSTLFEPFDRGRMIPFRVAGDLAALERFRQAAGLTWIYVGREAC